MLFDARAAKALGPGEAMAIPGAPGLRLLATAQHKTWTYRYKVLGQDDKPRLKQASLGHWPAVSFADAVVRWTALREGKAQGVDPAAARKQARQALQQQATPAAAKSYTVRDLVATYLDKHIDTNRTADSAKSARRALEGLLDAEPDFAAMAPAEVTRAVAFDLLEARKAKPTAAAKLRSLLGAAWDYGLDAGKIPGEVPNWWRQVMRGKLKSKGKIMGGEHIGKRRRALRDAEVAELLAWLPNMHDRGRDGVVLYLWTLARGGEIFGMRPEHIAREGKVWWWTIPKALTINRNHDHAVDQRVPLFGKALEVVQRRLASVGASGWLFENERGGQYTQHAFSTYIYDLQPYSPKSERRAKAGAAVEVMPAQDWTPHNLRRTGRTLLAALGCAKEIAEAIIGHMPPEIEATYNVHTYDKERQEWLRKVAAHWEGLPARP